MGTATRHGLQAVNGLLAQQLIRWVSCMRVNGRAICKFASNVHGLWLWKPMTSNTFTVCSVWFKQFMQFEALYIFKLRVRGGICLASRFTGASCPLMSGSVCFQQPVCSRRCGSHRQAQQYARCQTVKALSHDALEDSDAGSFLGEASASCQEKCCGPRMTDAL